MTKPDIATGYVLERLGRRLHIEAMGGPVDPLLARDFIRWRDTRDYVWWLRKNARPEAMRILWESKGRWN